VQQTLQDALVRMLGESDCHGEPLKATVAGRTDRGVHAWGQVVSYRHEAVDPKRVNALLPDDMAVISCEPAHADFDARRDAIARTYCYRVLARPARSALLRTSALWWAQPVDLHLLGACAELLLGTHDFTAFTPTETEHVRFTREISDAQWVTRDLPLGAPPARRPSPAAAGPGRSLGGPDTGQLLEFWIQADAFMRQMNRVLVGTMLEVACGKRTVDEFARLLEGRPRRDAGPTAPAHGLALASVTYPER
jgi:tRNA pseudouridine38-40 synthase